MAYKVGFCSQCDKQIMVRGANRAWSMLPIYRQVDISFEDGHRMRAAVCKDCAVNPDMSKIMESVTAEGSEAFVGRDKAREKISGKVPASVGLANAVQGMSLGEK